MLAVVESQDLSALLATLATAFEIVKYAGTAYLIFLGVKALIKKSSFPAKVISVTPASEFAHAETLQPQMSCKRYFPESVFSERVRDYNAIQQTLGRMLEFFNLSAIFQKHAICRHLEGTEEFF